MKLESGKKYLLKNERVCTVDVVGSGVASGVVYVPEKNDAQFDLMRWTEDGRAYSADPGFDVDRERSNEEQELHVAIDVGYTSLGVTYSARLEGAPVLPMATRVAYFTLKRGLGTDATIYVPSEHEPMRETLKEGNYRTRDGRLVTVWRTDVNGRLPVLGVVYGAEGVEARLWRDDGRLLQMNESPDDIMLGVEPARSIYFNLYEIDGKLSFTAHNERVNASRNQRDGYVNTIRVVLDSGWSAAAKADVAG